MADVTRREILIGAGAGLLLAACGAGERMQPSADSAGVAASTRSFEHVFATTEIPVDPQRIIAADVPTLGVMLGLGRKPLGAKLRSVSGVSYLEGRTDGIEDISTADGLNLEAIAALRPDLIVTFGADFNREVYDSLVPIAPTVAPAYDYVTLDQQFRHWRGVADAVGIPETGNEVIAALEARITALGDRLAAPMADRPVSVLRIGTESFYSVRFGTLESSLLETVNVPRPPNQQDPEGFAFDLSMERLEDVDAWGIFVYVDQGAEDERTSLEANPLWARLSAVQAGRVFFVDAGVWNGLDPIAANLVLDDIDHHLSAALATAT